MNEPPKVVASPGSDEEDNPWLFFPALLFVALTVAIVLLLPCVAALQTHRLAALVAMLFFFPLPTAACAYLWRFGYLEWPRPGPVPPKSHRVP